MKYDSKNEKFFIGKKEKVVLSLLKKHGFIDLNTAKNIYSTTHYGEKIINRLLAFGIVKADESVENRWKYLGEIKKNDSSGTG